MSKRNESLAAPGSGASGSAHDGYSAAVIAPVNNRSYVAGEKADPLRYVTIPEMFRQTVAKFGAREALIFPADNRTLTYLELDREIDALAAGLLALGLEKGDRIGIWSPNMLEWILTQYATARIGLILVNINPAYRLSELKYALNKSGCKALITAEKFKSSDYLGMIRTLAPELESCKPGRLVAAQLPALKTVIAIHEDPGPGIFPFSQIRDLGGPAQQARLDDISK
ncbi:MAG: AMP-binding protein, partial [Sneathiella sp.]|nr:AMP-binding protein [Sneathiella sp.]